MARILVLGATGYLGGTVSLTLLRTGLHTVYGLTRSKSGAKSLAAQEVIPVVCPDPANDPDPYLDAIRSKQINVVIDCTAAYGDSVKFLHAVQQLSQERLKMFKKEGIEQGPRIGYIYTSGAWVHGDSPEPVSDLDPVGTPSAAAKVLELVAWRPAIEREVLGSRDVMDIMIFRPATMYGRASSAWGGLFAPIAQVVKEGKGEVEMPLPREARVPVVHVDDVADAIARGVGSLEVLGGIGGYPALDLVGSKERLGDILDEFAKVVGASEGRTLEVRLSAKSAGESGNAFLEAMGSTVNMTSARAKQLLGWEPRREGLLSGMDLYAKAWEASS